MTGRPYNISFSDTHKLIVGEGESDLRFLEAFCAVNQIDGFEYAFAGIQNGNNHPPYQPSGFAEFKNTLPALQLLADFDLVTDIVLSCDSANNPAARLQELQTQIKKANGTIGAKLFDETPARNVVANVGMPRLHVLMVPFAGPGGLESLCVEVARDTWDSQGKNGTQIEGWVNDFADAACNAWTVEKRDKLRLQAFLSAAWKSKPDLHFSQLHDITRGHIVPLDSPSFGEVRTFLKAVAAL